MFSPLRKALLVPRSGTAGAHPWGPWPVGWGGIEQKTIPHEAHLPRCWAGRPGKGVRTGRAGPPSCQDPKLGLRMFLFGAEQGPHSGSETHGDGLGHMTERGGKDLAAAHTYVSRLYTTFSRDAHPPPPLAMSEGVGRGAAERTGRETVPARPPPRTRDSGSAIPSGIGALPGPPAQGEGERTGVRAVDGRGSRDTRVDPES